MASIFEVNAGLSQGRIEPSAVVPQSGEWLFVLGDSSESMSGELVDGDHVDVTQSVDVTSINLIQFQQLVFREPRDAEVGGFRWEVATLLDGGEVTSLRGHVGQSRTVPDLVLDVHHLSGVHVVGLRLSLVNA
jgi:hypothetical protein